VSAPLTRTEIARRRRTHANRLPHTCDVYRSVASSTNARGEVVYGTPAIALERLRCHLVAVEGRGETAEPTRTTIVREWRLYVPAETDILETDDVRNVRDQFGDVLATGPIQISQVVEHPTVTYAVLERAN
jgi:hypothetical protein